MFEMVASAAALFLLGGAASAQYRTDVTPEDLAAAETAAQEDTLISYFRTDSTLVLTLDDALEIAMSNNVSIRIADKEVERTGYAKKGTYAALFPTISGTGSYQRTLIKNDIRAMMGDSELTRAMGSKTKIGNTNTFSLGATAAVPIVNAQLWESVKISGLGVEAAVEKARASRLDMITQVKQAYFAVLLSKEAFRVYKDVYENAVANFEKIEKKHQAQKASEMEYLRAKTTVSNAIPGVFNAESTVILALWQLKAVLGIDLDSDIDTDGALNDYAEQLFSERPEGLSLTGNSTLRQMDIQIEQLRRNIRLQAFAYIPTVAVTVGLTYSSVANDPIESLNWFPYSYAGLSLSIPIFSGHKHVWDRKSARNQYEQLTIQRDDTERQMRIAAQNFLITMDTQMKNYYSTADAVETARKSYEIVAKSYELGRATLTDLNDAQLAMTQSMLSQSQAIYNYIVAKCQFEQMLGNDILESEEE